MSHITNFFVPDQKKSTGLRHPHTHILLSVLFWCSLTAGPVVAFVPKKPSIKTITSSIDYRDERSLDVPMDPGCHALLENTKHIC